MKLIPFLSQSKSLDSKLNSSPPWHFPSCGNINTLSFRATTTSTNNNTFYKDDNYFRTFNSAYLDTPESFFTVSSSSRSFSTMSDDNSGDPIESVIRGLRSSDRLFFEPEKSCSLVIHPQEQQHQQPGKEVDPAENGWVQDCSEDTGIVYKESEAMCMESNNPCEDFRSSMEEMIEAHGLKDWQGLEELLECYLKINDKINHAYIMGAFIDLLVNLSFIPNSSSNTTLSSLSSTNLNCSSPSSPLSLPSSSLTTSLSSLFDHGDDHCKHDDDNR